MLRWLKEISVKFHGRLIIDYAILSLNKLYIYIYIDMYHLIYLEIFATRNIINIFWRDFNLKLKYLLQGQKIKGLNKYLGWKF